MHEALLSEKLDNNRVRCNICRWRCNIAPDNAGVCRMYKNIGGTLFNMNYALASSVAIDPIEKKPLYPFLSRQQVFSLGSWGCNFHCQAARTGRFPARISPRPARARRKSRLNRPSTGQQNDCQGIAWTYNEPTMWFEYTLDSAKLAKQNNLYTVYVTNGYMTPEALDIIGPYLDAWRVDVKGFNDEFYRKLAKITHWEGILETAERAKHKWNMHVEVITNIIPTMNDDDEQLNGIADWIHDKLGELTPWHVTRFYPQYQATDLPATPIATLERALEIGQKGRVEFIYIGNVPGHDGENTICYNCGRLIVQRQGYGTRVLGLNGSKCKFCGAELEFSSA